MKMNWYDRKRWIYRVICSLTAAALAIGFTVVHPTLSKAAGHVDLDKDCTLTVKPSGIKPSGTDSEEENQKFLEDLKEAKVVIDLYKVADAVEVKGYDTYTYETILADSDLDFSKAESNADWMELAQKAAGEVFKDSKQNYTPVVGSGQAAGTAITPLKAGLYLVIARGENPSDVKDYVSYVTKEDTAGSETEGEMSSSESIVTIAHSKAYTYTFAPELISLPYRGDPNRSEEEDRAGTAAQYGDWKYELEIALKPERKSRYVSLDIVKELPKYSTINPAATFVFQIEAYFEDGKDDWKYSDVVSISFSEGENDLRKSLESVIDKIRVGATVKVTEVYTGVTYTYEDGYGIVYNVGVDGRVPEGGPIPAVDRTVTFQAVEAGKEYAVVFVNDYDDTGKHGGAVTNRYENVKDEKGHGWEPTQIYDSEQSPGDDTQ